MYRERGAVRTESVLKGVMEDIVDEFEVVT